MRYIAYTKHNIVSGLVETSIVSPSASDIFPVTRSGFLPYLTMSVPIMRLKGIGVLCPNLRDHCPMMRMSGLFRLVFLYLISRGFEKYFIPLIISPISTEIVAKITIAHNMILTTRRSNFSTSGATHGFPPILTSLLSEGRRHVYEY